MVIVEGVKGRSEVVVLGSVAPAPAAPAADATPATGGGGSSQKTIGLVVGGMGVAGLAAGSIFGLMASSSWSTAQKEQSGAQYQQATNDQKTASTYATVSTVAFIAGGIAVAAGAVLWFTAPSGESGGAATMTAWSVAPSVSPGGGGVLMQGGF